MVQENPQFLLFNNNLLFFYLFMAIIGFKVTRTIVPQNIAAGTTICNCSTQVGTEGAPVTYSLLSGSAQYNINTSNGAVTAKQAMTKAEAQSFQIRVTDATSATQDSEILKPQFQAVQQPLFSESNKIYKITSIVDLDGDILQVGEGSTLEFDGGKIINGKLRGNYITIAAPPIQIFDLTTDIVGWETWNVDKVYPEWFNPTSSSGMGWKKAIQKCIDSFHTVYIWRDYMVSGIGGGGFSGIQLQSNVTIKGIDPDTSALYPLQVPEVFYIPEDSENITIENISIGSLSQGSAMVGIQGQGIITDVTLKNVVFKRCSTAINNVTGPLINWKIRDCEFIQSTDSGVGLYSQHSEIKRTTIEFSGCYFNSLITPMTIFKSEQVLIRDCIFEGGSPLSSTEAVVKLVDCRNYIIEDCIFNNYSRNLKNNAIVEIIGFAYGSIRGCLFSSIQNTNGQEQGGVIRASNNTWLTVDNVKFQEIGTDTNHLSARGTASVEVRNTVNPLVIFQQSSNSTVNLDGAYKKRSGSTASRPTNVAPGFIYYDSSLVKCIVFTELGWRNMDGSALA